MKIRVLAGIVLLIILLIITYKYLKPKIFEKPLANNEEQYNMYCGSCHLVPNPKNIPKSLWMNKVLPEMAAKMGYVYNDNVPFQRSMEERFYVKKSKAYPETSMIDSVKWNEIHEYILSLAPDTVYNTPNRKERNSKLNQFSVLFDSINTNMLTESLVNIKFNASTNQLFTSDVYGNLYAAKKGMIVKEKFNSPVISTVLKDSSLYITEIGILNPSEIPKGAIYKKEGDSLRLLYKDLHRPVYTEVEDLNGDDIKEIIICEFGYHTGELSMLVEKDSILEKKTLSNLPGSIKVEIKDMNGDGKKDIIALFSQAREGVYILYQKNDFQFDVQPVVQMGPEYGISWFELVDYNKDGHLDIVIANGDNADYSIFLKPYHGVRIFLNNGENKFEEKWFYPINGATRVLVEDYDLDGDLDIAVLSYFPDMVNCPEEGFVYLENKDSKEFLFDSFVAPETKKGHWLVMDKGDFDEDGDVDIMLGGFYMLPQKGGKYIKGYNHLFLTNEQLN